MTEANFDGWTCPIPLKNYPTIVMGHGAGGKMMNDLIAHLFAPLFDNDLLGQMGDSTTLDMGTLNGGRMAFSTDSFVVSPIIFPGGDIGDLAVNGTVNDIAMSGAKPLYLSAGFILEEGLPMETLAKIAASMANAARLADVQVVTGDTKVVNKGHGDGVFINTSGFGIIPDGIDIAAKNARPGDMILVSGTMGDHGMAIMSKREGLEFESQIMSDTAPLHGMISEMLDITKEIHCLRDATRGGLSAVLNELADVSKVGIEFEETKVPVNGAVNAACEMLGLDPFYIANEGKLVAIVAPDVAEEVLATMQANEFGKDAAIIGTVTEVHPKRVVAKTAIGGSRVVDLPAGELLPRIC
ncbi:MAG: hydrogenase expression/formation protein HypE [Chloroflexi bacterium]|nr:hydrogenase expression/formation protein HypE [Chloroflexota bacterium]